jgi:hypothetical protein
VDGKIVWYQHGAPYLSPNFQRNCRLDYEFILRSWVWRPALPGASAEVEKLRSEVSPPHTPANTHPFFL